MITVGRLLEEVTIKVFGDASSRGTGIQNNVSWEDFLQTQKKNHVYEWNTKKIKMIGNCIFGIGVILAVNI